MAKNEGTVDVKGNNVSHERTPLLHATGESTNNNTPVKPSSPSVEEVDPDWTEEDIESEKPGGVVKVIFCVLLLGCFLANAVGAIVLATNQHIASKFNALSSAAWLLTIYTLAQCASQPLYGKLTDIFGAKKVLSVCWLTFIMGDVIVGIAPTFGQALVGRSISGIGAAGMISLASVIVTELVPLSEVATYRAYINVTATVARSIGGPIGAWIAGNMSWRWCFIIPCPITLTGLVFILWKLPESSKTDNAESQSESGLKRVDFAGAAALVGLILSFLLLLDRATKNGPLYITIPLGAATIIFLTIFFVVERSFAKEPILPLQLLAKRDVYMPYLIVGCKSAGQFTLLYSIPIYFIVVQGEGVASAGTRIVPVVVGNAIGTILSGRIIGRSQQYKTLTLCAIGVGLVGWILILLSWNGKVNLLQSLYVMLPGLGMGTIQSSTFVHLAASLDRSEISIAGTTWFLAQSVGYLVGASVSTALINAMLRTNLDHGLAGLPDKAEIVRKVISNIEDVRQLPNAIQEVVAHVYVSSLHWAYGLSICFLTTAFIITMFLKEKPLK